MLRQCHLVALGTHDTREPWQESNPKACVVSPGSSQRSPKEGAETRKGARCRVPPVDSLPTPLSPR